MQQNLGVAAVAKVSGISFSNLEFSHQSHPNLISKDKNEIMKSFALEVWQLTPRNNSDLVKYALIIDKDHKLSWLDVLTLNPAPSPSMFNAVTVHYGSSGKGWLSKYVVDAYLTVIVHKANQKKNLDYFENLDCDHSSILINCKPIKNKHIFARQILNSKSNELRTNILVPVLSNKHFLLLWFCRSTNCLTLFDSMKGNFNENFSYLRIFVEFFRSFSNNNQEIVMQHSSVINQPDENSRGVCVCLAAMAIFESVFNDKSVVEFSTASVNDFRYSITYELCASAIQCAPLLNEVGKGTLDDGAVTGLPNLGNTCWFNATVQAIVTVIKKVNSAEIKSSAHLNDDELQSFLVQIVNGKLNVEAYFQKTILSVCKKCIFQYGAQQDAEEFYRLSNSTNILRSFETPSVLKWQISYRCKNCNAISSDEMEEHPDLILLLEAHSTGNSLKDIFDNFCDGKETKRCSKKMLCYWLTLNQSAISKRSTCLGNLLWQNHT